MMSETDKVDAFADRLDECEMKPIERPVPPIAYIVARSVPDGVIGCDNELPWKLRTDLKFFKSVTQNHVVIMGRKTLESLGRPLPNRVNVVVSTKPGSNSDNLIWADSPETALYVADFISILRGMNQIIVIGGAQIYQIFKKQFTKIYLTEVHHKFECGDAYFKEEFDFREWDRTAHQKYYASEFDQYDFEISIMERRNKFTRHRELYDFYVRERLDAMRDDFAEFANRFKQERPAGGDQIALPLKVA